MCLRDRCSSMCLSCVDGTAALFCRSRRERPLLHHRTYVFCVRFICTSVGVPSIRHRPGKAELAQQTYGGTTFRVVGINTAIKDLKDEECQMQIVVNPGIHKPQMLSVLAGALFFGTIHTVYDVTFSERGGDVDQVYAPLSSEY